MREATVHVPDEALSAFGVAEFVAVVRDAGLDAVTELQCRRPGCLLVVEVSEPIPSDRLDGLDELAWWERLDDGAGPTYLCKLAVPALGEGLDPHHESDASQADLAATDDGIDVTMVGTQESLADRVADYDAGPGVVLRSLGDYDGPRAPLDALTDRQREVLATAVACGYFAVPREATTADVAAELGVEPSTVREHLQRGLHNLLTALFE
jgi:DNA-binding CsgD family transcriptional regulator